MFHISALITPKLQKHVGKYNKIWTILPYIRSRWERPLSLKTRTRFEVLEDTRKIGSECENPSLKLKCNWYQYGMSEISNYFNRRFSKQQRTSKIMALILVNFLKKVMRRDSPWQIKQCLSKFLWRNNRMNKIALILIKD